ncbi:MAG: TenA family transcriptional regulator [candidate division Zixibacteria bacterium]|nr:TenA family transcriptional regulator [candidate division Zixibacteria bacterium]MDH3938831.1 TenA family transcriptional regulator [candidate division Zixibacteria bacterium]MDH4032401.1 TenA family transcriptional regulator [candidate division Zixibacteria bacterium]
MRSPRRLVLSDELIAKHSMVTDPPPQDSLFWKMWNACTQIAADALATGYIQGIKAGNLDPVKYGAFMVSDAYYCFNGAQDYLAAETRTSDPELKAYLLAKYSSYQKYNQTFPDIWHVRDARGVVPLDICKEYSAWESTVASHEDPVYTVVALLPCEYIWYWLANQLAPPTPGNLYAEWITDNDSPKGAYAMGNYLVKYMAENPGVIDETKAIQLYTQAITYEQKNFAAATA